MSDTQAVKVEVLACLMPKCLLQWLLKCLKVSAQVVVDVSDAQVVAQVSAEAALESRV